VYLLNGYPPSRICANLSETDIKNTSFCHQFAPEFGSTKHGFPAKLALMRLRGDDGVSYT
jgi:hypothetical protein